MYLGGGLHPSVVWSDRPQRRQMFCETGTVYVMVCGLSPVLLLWDERSGFFLVRRFVMKWTKDEW